MRHTEPVIEDSGSVEDVHHLWLMALLHELVREKGNRGAASALGIDPRAVASCMKTGRLSWWVREALERELQSGAGSAAAQQLERNDAVVRRVRELEEKTRSGHRGSVRPASRRCRRRCCASGIALATRPQKSVEWFRWVRCANSWTTTYSMRACSSIMVRQLKRSVPSGAQLPQRWRWSRTSICDFSPRPSRGHQRSTASGNRSAARSRYHPTTARRIGS